ncbi:MAG: hypothetical protein ABR543_13870 [Gemmatimonadaceae bacterium]
MGSFREVLSFPGLLFEEVLDFLVETARLLVGMLTATYLPPATQPTSELRLGIH